jgi:hypothetical protein
VSGIDTFALLEDLARLIKKHGPTAFTDLSALLRNPEKLDELIGILEAGASAGRRAKMPKREKPSPYASASSGSLNLLLSKMRTIDPAKAEILSRFYDELTSKHVLPTLREIREFAHDNHLRGADVDSRSKAIGQLLRDLSERPSEQLNAILKRVHYAERPRDDRSLERWADIILDKDRSHRGN